MLYTPPNAHPVEGNSTDFDPQDQTENTTDFVSISHTYTVKLQSHRQCLNSWRLPLFLSSKHAVSTIVFVTVSGDGQLHIHWWSPHCATAHLHVFVA